MANVKRSLYDFQLFFFNTFVIISYILIILSFFNLYGSASLFLNKLDYYIRIYICLFLIWRFNPFRSSYEFTNLDRKIAFSAGLFILTTSALKTYLDKIIKYIKDVISQKQV